MLLEMCSGTIYKSLDVAILPSLIALPMQSCSYCKSSACAKPSTSKCLIWQCYLSKHLTRLREMECGERRSRSKQSCGDKSRLGSCTKIWRKQLLARLQSSR